MRSLPRAADQLPPREKPLLDKNLSYLAFQGRRVSCGRFLRDQTGFWVRSKLAQFSSKRVPIHSRRSAERRSKSSSRTPFSLSAKSPVFQPWWRPDSAFSSSVGAPLRRSSAASLYL